MKARVSETAARNPTSRNASIARISGPVVVAKGLSAAMHEIVLLGHERLMGEVIRIDESVTTVQVYEDTTGLRPGEPVVGTGHPLTVELGPGLLAGVFDGIERPLPELASKQGSFIGRGMHATPLSRSKRWKFFPTVQNGTRMHGGQSIGYVEEMPGFKHHILVPPGTEGIVRGMKSGMFTVEDTLCEITPDTSPNSMTGMGKERSGKLISRSERVTLMQTWPIRTPRPITKKHLPDTPLITGQRVIDALFPVAKGGTAIVSGPFGSGKTVLQHQLAKWSDADIIVYVGCGERGNEMTQVIVEFPHLKDPKTGQPLLQRTVLIANTSNMPVAAREASIYTGVTIAEYFRDMGYHVALMADSTSRWAEALREISSRLGEMPGEEGYPAYLAGRIAGFYERAGTVTTLGSDERRGSLTIIGAVSPPGGDFFEPVTQASLRITKAFWSLDARIAQQRHFPSINWLSAYSLYTTSLQEWYKQRFGTGWNSYVTTIKITLQEESRLMEIVRLVGSDALPDRQRWTLHVARLIREGFLQQEARDEKETYCSLDRMHRMMRIIITYHETGLRAIDNGAPFSEILSNRIDRDVFALRLVAQTSFESAADAVESKIQNMGPTSRTTEENASENASDETGTGKKGGAI